VCVCVCVCVSVCPKDCWDMNLIGKRGVWNSNRSSFAIEKRL